MYSWDKNLQGCITMNKVFNLVQGITNSKVAKYNHQSKVHFALSISVVRSTLSRNVGIFRDVLVDSNTDKGRETGRKD